MTTSSKLTTFRPSFAVAGVFQLGYHRLLRNPVHDAAGRSKSL